MGTIPKNISEFLTRASKDVGRIEQDYFSQEMYVQIIELGGRGISSPIEQAFFIAMHVMCRAHYLPINQDPELIDGKPSFPSGVYMSNQFQLDLYKIDFHVSHCRAIGPKTSTVLVELDGHDFHDRDKHQRSYEKARERYIARAGRVLLRYTGSDVMKDPYRVAHEVMDTIECFGPMGSCEYDPTNPFGIE